MQETQVQSLIQEDPTCLGVTEPVSHNYWVCALEPRGRSYQACVPGAHALQQEKTLQWEACAARLESSPRLLKLEKSPGCNEDQFSQK